jgi:hypothetical protein
MRKGPAKAETLVLADWGYEKPVTDEEQHSSSVSDARTRPGSCGDDIRAHVLNVG